MVNIAGSKCICLPGASYIGRDSYTSQVSNIVMLTINSRSPWEILSGFNLTAKRRAKRQGMKLCSGIRTICDSTWLDQSHACYLYARKLDPTAGSLWLESRRHATWINHPFVVISMSKVELYFSCIFLSCFPDIKVWKLLLISSKFLQKDCSVYDPGRYYWKWDDWIFPFHLTQIAF